MPGNELIGNLEYQEVKKYLKKWWRFICARL